MYSYKEHKGMSIHVLQSFMEQDLQLYDALDYNILISILDELGVERCIKTPKTNTPLRYRMVLGQCDALNNHGVRCKVVANYIRTEKSGNYFVCGHHKTTKKRHYYTGEYYFEPKRISQSSEGQRL